jgi:hypothetical protein
VIVVAFLPVVVVVVVVVVVIIIIMVMMVIIVVIVVVAVAVAIVVSPNRPLCYCLVDPVLDILIVGDFRIHAFQDIGYIKGVFESL